MWYFSTGILKLLRIRPIRTWWTKSKTFQCLRKTNKSAATKENWTACWTNLWNVKIAWVFYIFFCFCIVEKLHSSGTFLQPTDEPVLGKEKKRRKLDEIVLGLSAAKEQQSNHYPEPSKKGTVTPNVTVTPTSVSMGMPAPPTSQKPFSITVTSIPSSRSSGSSFSNLPPNLSTLHSHKDSFSALLAQAEHQTREMAKKQHHQPSPYNSAHISSSSSSASHRKTYEAMMNDLNKVAEYSSKIGSYSHEMKVNKWLEGQSMSEQLNAEYLNAPRRRRPRVDPSLLDWKKLTGEENVAVINRMTGKKVIEIVKYENKDNFEAFLIKKYGSRHLSFVPMFQLQSWQ